MFFFVIQKGRNWRSCWRHRVEGFLLKALEPNTTSDDMCVGRQDGKVLRESCLRRLSTAQNVLASITIFTPPSAHAGQALSMVWRVNVRNQLQFPRNPPILIFAAMTSNKKLYPSSSKLILILPAHIRVRSFQVTLNNFCRMKLQAMSSDS